MPLSQWIKPLLEGGSTSYTPLSHWIKPLLEEGSTFYIFSNRGSGLLTPLSQPVTLPLEEERTFILDGNVIFFPYLFSPAPSNRISPSGSVHAKLSLHKAVY